jgi:hypothetical protein
LNVSTAPPGTSSADDYVWGSSIAGSWDVASNWNDTTAGQSPASVAPGINDNVTIDASGGGATDVITGTGNSASLTIEGTTVLAGQFTTGTLSLVATPGVFDGAGSLQLNAGDTLTVTGDAGLVQHASLTLGGTLTVDGNFSGGSDNGLTIDGGTLTAGSLTTSETFFYVSAGASLLVSGNVTNNYFYSSYQITGSTFTVDGTFISESDSIVATSGSRVDLSCTGFG